MDSLAIQRSLTLLVERYRELQEIGEKHFQAWQAERADLQQQLHTGADHLAAMQASHQAELNAKKKDSDRLQSELSTTKQDYNRLRSELNDSRQEAELLVLQLHQVQEELEHYFLRSRDLEAQVSIQADELDRLRIQRQLLMTMLSCQWETFDRLHTLQHRIAIPAVLAFDRLGGSRWLKRINGKKGLKQSTRAGSKHPT